MLYWNANFQIPNSGTQAAEVFVVVEGNLVSFYGDVNKSSLLFTKEYDFKGINDPYSYLLSLTEYNNYKKV